MTYIHRYRAQCILAISLTVIAIIFLLPPIPQDATYHQFADQRTFALPHMANVFSNMLFLVFGGVGVWCCVKRRYVYADPFEQLLWIWFFLSSAMVGVGSAYYHMNPNNDTLLWDRLPMTLAFMSFFTLVIIERISLRAGKHLFPLLSFIGIISVIYWHHTEQMGEGDLRLYVLVQFLPLLLIPFILWQYEARYSHAKYIVYTIAFYALAKLLEHYDAAIYVLTSEVVSGHALKHIAASYGVLMLVYYVTNRHKLEKN